MSFDRLSVVERSNDLDQHRYSEKIDNATLYCIYGSQLREMVERVGPFDEDVLKLYNQCKKEQEDINLIAAVAFERGNSAHIQATSEAAEKVQQGIEAYEKARNSFIDTASLNGHPNLERRLTSRRSGSKSDITFRKSRKSIRSVGDVKSVDKFEGLCILIKKLTGVQEGSFHFVAVWEDGDEIFVSKPVNSKTKGVCSFKKKISLGQQTSINKSLCINIFRGGKEFIGSTKISRKRLLAKKLWTRKYELLDTNENQLGAFISVSLVDSTEELKSTGQSCNQRIGFVDDFAAEFGKDDFGGLDDFFDKDSLRNRSLTEFTTTPKHDFNTLDSRNSQITTQVDPLTTRTSTDFNTKRFTADYDQLITRRSEELRNNLQLQEMQEKLNEVKTELKQTEDGNQDLRKQLSEVEASKSDKERKVLALTRELEETQERLSKLHEKLKMKEESFINNEQELNKRTNELKLKEGQLQDCEELLRDTRHRLFWEKKRSADLCGDINAITAQSERIKSLLHNSRASQDTTEVELLRLQFNQECLIMANHYFIKQNMNPNPKENEKMLENFNNTSVLHRLSERALQDSHGFRSWHNGFQQELKDTCSTEKPESHHVIDEYSDIYEVTPAMLNRSIFPQQPRLLTSRAKQELSYMFCNAIINGSGYIFKDRIITVFFKVKEIEENSAVFRLIVTIQSLAVERIEVSPVLERTLPGVEVTITESDIDPLQPRASREAHYTGRIAVTHPYVDPPLIDLSYMLNDSGITCTRLRVPISIISFLTPEPPLSASKFAEQYDRSCCREESQFVCQLKQVYLQPGGYEIFSKVITCGGNLGIQHHIDPSPDVIIVAGRYKTHIRSAIKVTRGRGASSSGKCKVHIRSSSGIICKALQKFLVETVCPLDDEELNIYEKKRLLPSVVSTDETGNSFEKLLNSSSLLSSLPNSRCVSK